MPPILCLLGTDSAMVLMKTANFSLMSLLYMVLMMGWLMGWLKVWMEEVLISPMKEKEGTMMGFIATPNFRNSEITVSLKLALISCLQGWEKAPPFKVGITLQPQAVEGKESWWWTWSWCQIGTAVKWNDVSKEKPWIARIRKSMKPLDELQHVELIHPNLPVRKCGFWWSHEKGNQWRWALPGLSWDDIIVNDIHTCSKSRLLLKSSWLQVLCFEEESVDDDDKRKPWSVDCYCSFLRSRAYILYDERLIRLSVSNKLTNVQSYSTFWGCKERRCIVKWYLVYVVCISFPCWNDSPFLMYTWAGLTWSLQRS